MQSDVKKIIMRYSFEKVNTVQTCDALLAGAQRKKQTLERKRRNLGEAIGIYRKRMDQLHQELALVQSSLGAYTIAYNALPEGTKDKARMYVEIKRLELRQARLSQKAFTYNVSSLMAKEIKYNVLDSQLSAVESYMVAIHQRRSILDHTGLPMSEATAVLRPSVAREDLQFENGSSRAYFQSGLLYTKNNSLKKASKVFERLMRSPRPGPVLIT